VGRVLYDASMSLDGYVAGDQQSVVNPLGRGGERLHEWMMKLAAWREAAGLEGGEVNSDSGVLEEEDTEGAIIMGRNMFGGGPGPWRDDPPWTGWWGDDPPFHKPVFVLTHFPRPRLELKGGNTFTFVTDGIESALAQAREAAGDRDVGIGGGHTAAQYLSRGLIDQVTISLVPVLLGGGVRLFDLVNAANVRLEQVRVREGAGVVHLTYRIATP
jgi:dihydrofolate reductase